MQQLKVRTKFILGMLMLVVVVGLLLYFLPKSAGMSDYIFQLRLKKILVYLVVAVAASFATISFQTVTGNRFLTPAVLGLESLYVFIQSTYLFFFWRWANQHQPSVQVEFLIVLGLLLLFFGALQPLLKQLLSRGFGTILLICMSLGTLLRSLSTFMQILMDPNEYDKLQGKLFASFQHAHQDVLVLVGLATLILAYYLYRLYPVLDVLHLGKEQALSLGVDVEAVQRRILWAVVILTASTTAMVGPLSFFGFIVANLTYRLVKQYQHHYLFLVATCLGFVSLVYGQMLVERFFQYAVTISMILELFGGSFFLYLVYKERLRYD